MSSGRPHGLGQCAFLDRRNYCCYCSSLKSRGFAAPFIARFESS